MRRRHIALVACGIFLTPPAFLAAPAGAHGFVGDRFFPPTITTDDPFAVDELSLPTIAYNSDSQIREADTGFEFDKEIFRHFALGISDDYIAQRGRDHGPSAYGWDNLSITAKYQLWQNDTHETIFAVGVEADLGGTGSKSVAESSSTLIPTFYFGKGFGDLPESLDPVRPLAVTGTLAQSFPTSRRDANQFQWGFAVEYSLPYLQEEVKDIGLPSPLKDMIPLVEFTLATDENRASAGITTGTVNPGVLWETPYCQIGAEALVPVNGQSGPHVGFIVQAWIFIDDLFPKVFGFPIFGRD